MKKKRYKCFVFNNNYNWYNVEVFDGIKWNSIYPHLTYKNAKDSYFILCDAFPDCIFRIIHVIDINRRYD